MTKKRPEETDTRDVAFGGSLSGEPAAGPGYRFRFGMHRVFVCGTRVVVQRGPDDFRVVCATCDAGGSVHHTTKQQATHACVRDSNKRCTACGAS